MTTADYLVLLFYLAGTLTVGVVLAARNKSSEDMFSTSGQSPWWAAGLSGFMTMFSAGTFVVWGGIAYEHGLVAVSINLCYGIAALAAGRFVATKWKNLGVSTPARFIQLRFGTGPLHFYTWSMLAFKLLATSVALYSLAVILVEQMPLEAGNPLRDPATGKLSLNWAIGGLGAVVVAYTVIGGLWGVLMTDVLQFIVLNMAVLFVIPLMAARGDGAAALIEQAPAGFFSPVNDRFTWFFLAGWVAIHYFVVGAEWAFVQRFICVPSARDARKGAYLFGILYLVSPLVWMAPPLLLGIQEPMAAGLDAEAQRAIAERAYVHACELVLPSGMMGLMLAAMFSATASTVSGQLNVFAGVLTNDILRPLAGRKLDERGLVGAGRLITGALGFILILLAIAVPAMGGARDVAITAASLAVGPLLAPTIWGLFSRRVGAGAVWWTAGVCIAIGILAKFGLTPESWLVEAGGLAPIAQWAASHSTTVDILLGVALPVCTLTIVEISSRGVSEGWLRIAALPPPAASAPAEWAARPLALVVAVSLFASGGVMLVIAVINAAQRGIVLAFAAALVGLGLAVLAAAWRLPRACPTSLTYAETPVR